jgi:hypothetical protein
MTTIIVPMEDEPVHTDAHPYCSDASCPCRDEKPEVGTHVLIEVAIRDYYDDSMMVAGGWMPLSRIKSIVPEVQDEVADVPPSEAELDAQEQTAGPRRIDWSKIFDDGAQLRDRDQERNVTHQCADGSWW